METITLIMDTEPDLGSGEQGRIKQHVAPDRRISIEDKDIRHGRKEKANAHVCRPAPIAWSADHC